MSSRAAAPPPSATIVLVDDDREFVGVVDRVLRQAGYRVEIFGSGEACLEGLSRILPDAICLDLSMPGIGGLETLGRLRITHPQLPVIMLTSEGAVATVVTAMQMGAYDYLQKPVDPTRLTTAIRNAVDRAHLLLRTTQLEREADEPGYGPLIGRSAAMRAMFRQMDRLATSDITVLIQGESGTGKELVARALHEHSGRRRKPFVALNCSAIPETLQESELFGHERGAFTGATERRLGKFEQANGGTLFLDEVAELSPGLQAKLLRALQSRTFQRVGGSIDVHSDFRLLAATHTRLDELVRSGRFREDLFFRLAVFELDVPPLRTRIDDVPALAARFAAEAARREGRRPALSPRAEQMLSAYDWPGNVRELENAIHRALVASNGEVIEADDLPPAVRRTGAQLRRATDVVEAPTAPAVVAHAASRSINASGELNIDALERAAIIEALRQSDGNVSEAMRMLGIGRTTLYRKMKRYGIEPR